MTSDQLIRWAMLYCVLCQIESVCAAKGDIWQCAWAQRARRDMRDGLDQTLKREAAA
jgi:hypothetical protein